MIAAWFLLAAGVCTPETLSNEFARIAAQAQGRVGVAATVLEGGGLTALHGAEHFPMQSVYKFPIAMWTLHQVDAGALHLDDAVKVDRAKMVPSTLHSPIRDAHPDGVSLPVRELLRYTIVESDGTASDVLLRISGGAEAVTRYLRSLGVEGMVVETTERAMGLDRQAQYRNWATPEAAVALLRAFWEGRGLSAASRGLLLRWMTETGTGSNRIKGGLPAGTVVAHKTGSSGSKDGVTEATNDIGVITLPEGRHLALAVFVSDAKADTAAGERVIAGMARAAWGCVAVR